MDLLSLRQAARELHCAERVLRSAVRNGELPAFQLGERTLRVERDELFRWVRSKRIATWRNGRGQA
jgi:excisionase family DNA binding protein